MQRCCSSLSQRARLVRAWQPLTCAVLVDTLHFRAYTFHAPWELLLACAACPQQDRQIRPVAACDGNWRLLPRLSGLGGLAPDSHQPDRVRCAAAPDLAQGPPSLGRPRWDIMPLQIVLQGIRGIDKEQWSSGGQVFEHLQAVSRAGVHECLKDEMLSSHCKRLKARWMHTMVISHDMACRLLLARPEDTPQQCSSLVRLQRGRTSGWRQPSCLWSTSTAPSGPPSGRSAARPMPAGRTGRPRRRTARPGSRRSSPTSSSASWPASPSSPGRHRGDTHCAERAPSVHMRGPGGAQRPWLAMKAAWHLQACPGAHTHSAL